FGGVDRPEGGDRDELARALQSAPRVAAISRVFGHAGHRQWVQGLQQQGPDAPGIHGRMALDPADRLIRVVPALAGCHPDVVGTLIGFWAGNTVPQRIGETTAGDGNRGTHVSTIARGAWGSGRACPFVCAAAAGALRRVVVGPRPEGQRSGQGLPGALRPAGELRRPQPVMY